MPISVDKVLSRGVETILPSKEGLKKLLESKKIKLYLGIDPSNPQIHLGNAVPLRKLRQLQVLGHKVILLIGDFTGMIGDPTDKSATRKRLTKEQVLENAKTYRQQAAKILDFEGKNPAEIKFNSTWLSKLTPEDWIELTSLVTVQQLEERDMFVKRKREGKPIFLNEFLYPLMQGYDSVAMDVDLEIGGTDQTFNMLMGRQLLKTFKGKEKYVIAVPLLLGTDGAKMGKSTGNFIAISQAPSDMFGKVMSIQDDLIKDYFELTTDVDLGTVDFSEHPMDLKKKLAFEIVKIYHGLMEATKAKEEFERVFQKRESPKVVDQIVIKRGIRMLDFLIGNNFAASLTIAKKLIGQNAVEIDGNVTNDGKAKLENGQLIKIGKKIFVKVIVK